MLRIRSDAEASADRQELTGRPIPYGRLQGKIVVSILLPVVRRLGATEPHASGDALAWMAKRGHQMLVIHGVWAYGALQAWAEDSVLPAHAPPRQGRPSRAPRPHPFAVPAGQLADALAAAGAGDLARKAVDDELTLRLPSAADGPQASPELARPPAEALPDSPAARRIALASWRVPALVFEPPAAIALLPALADLVPGDLTVAGSIGYLAAVARFADDLVTRGRVLPTLIKEDDEYAACWRPVLSAADAQRARDLAAAVPAACRALADVAAAAAAGPLLAGMLDALADATARTRMPGALLPARRGRRPARIPVIERTVESLTASEPLVEVESAEDEAEARELASAFAEWLASAARPAGPVRTCFRLIEPPAPPVPDPAYPEISGSADDDSRWSVEFSLQSTEDPSLMLPAPDVWAGAGLGWLAATALPNTGHPDEELLAGLGAAGAEADRQVIERVVALGPAEPVRPAGPGRLPVRAGGGRRGPVGGRAGRAGPAQGPSRPHPRAVGGARRPSPEGGAEVPRGQPIGVDDRRRRAHRGDGRRRGAGGASADRGGR
jgi:hypothetical protein